MCMLYSLTYQLSLEHTWRYKAGAREAIPPIHDKGDQHNISLFPPVDYNQITPNRANKKETAGKVQQIKLNTKRTDKTKKNSVPIARPRAALRDKTKCESCDKDKHLPLSSSLPHSSRATCDESATTFTAVTLLHCINSQTNNNTAAWWVVYHSRPLMRPLVCAPCVPYNLILRVLYNVLV